MLRYLTIPLLLMSLLLSACQTSMVKQFDRLKPGMEKDDVLDLMGSPDQTQRFHGKDRWYYVFYDKRTRFEKEVHFFKGNAIYIGDTWEPPQEQSAVAVDARNEARNKAIDAEIAKEEVANRAAYSGYESAVKGEDKVRYVPSFEPIR
ncbi:Outer membrane protein assembly factor BamE [compost metagenome]